MNNVFFDLSDKVILVTGAAGHLGTAISKRLAQAGAFIYLAGRSKQNLTDIEISIKNSGGDAKALPLDITDTDNVTCALATVASEKGRLHGLVNNAFHALAGSIETSTIQDFQKAFETNVSALFYLSQQCLPLLAQENENDDFGSIVNIASMYGMVSPDPSIYGDTGMNNPPFYGASKAAIIQLSRYFAGHATQRGIRTNTISPGAFPPQSLMHSYPEFHEELKRKNPMHRIGHPDEVAAAVHFLLSNDASYINGANITVDGGWTAW